MWAADRNTRRWTLRLKLNAAAAKDPASHRLHVMLSRAVLCTCWWSHKLLFPWFVIRRIRFEPAQLRATTRVRSKTRASRLLVPSADSWISIGVRAKYQLARTSLRITNSAFHIERKGGPLQYPVVPLTARW